MAINLAVLLVEPSAGSSCLLNFLDPLRDKLVHFTCWSQLQISAVPDVACGMNVGKTTLI